MKQRSIFDFTFFSNTPKNAKVFIKVEGDDNMLPCKYKGRDTTSGHPLEAVETPDGLYPVINSKLTLFNAKKRKIGDFFVVNVRQKQNLVMLIQQKNIPIVD